MLAGDAEPWLDVLLPATREPLMRLLDEHREPEAAAVAWLCDLLEPDRAGQSRDELEEEARTLVGGLRHEFAQRLCAGRYAGERATLADRTSGAATAIVVGLSAQLAAHGGVPQAVATPIAAVLLAQAAVIGRRAFCRHMAPPSPRSAVAHEDPAEEAYRFDVALSYATEDRPYVKRVAKALIDHGVAVFYDQFSTVELWGADLTVYFDEVYRLRSRFVVVFGSADYVAKAWPMRELQSALAGAILLRRDSILPARLDDTALPGVLATIGSVNCQNRTPETLASILIEKIARTVRPSR